MRDRQGRGNYQSSAAKPNHIPAWRPDRYAARRPNLLRRNALQRSFEGWFEREGFLRVETPALQISPGLEPNLTAFGTDMVAPDGTVRRRYLHTSPEFAMKKLLAAGEQRLFQFARVWRNAERADTHHPEFTMLEWYRAHADYSALMEDCAALLMLVGDLVSWRGRTCDLRQAPERLTVSGAFRRHCGVDLVATMGDAPALARGCGVRFGEDDTWDDVFFRAMGACVEPHLGLGRPTLLHDYPAHMAALAKVRRDVAERVELYVCGLELANGFSELTDAAEQHARFVSDCAARERVFGASYPIDNDFLAALDGMPDAAGMALGFDRLVMLATGADRIEDVLWLPVD